MRARTCASPCKISGNGFDAGSDASLQERPELSSGVSGFCVSVRPCLGGVA